MNATQSCERTYCRSCSGPIRDLKKKNLTEGKRPRLKNFACTFKIGSEEIFKLRNFNFYQTQINNLQKKLKLKIRPQIPKRNSIIFLNETQLSLQSEQTERLLD